MYLLTGKFEVVSVGVLAFELTVDEDEAPDGEEVTVEPPETAGVSRVEVDACNELDVIVDVAKVCTEVTKVFCTAEYEALEPGVATRLVLVCVRILVR